MLRSFAMSDVDQSTHTKLRNSFAIPVFRHLP